MITNILLELLNGGSALAEALFLLWAMKYLWKESRRRNLPLSAWYKFRLPLSMTLMASVVVFDFSTWMRSVVIWDWRVFYGAGAFVGWQIALLIIAGGIGIWGTLCKIRAVTYDYGDEPWVICLALLLVFVVMSVLARTVFS